jgi:hypothetical protein
MTAAGPSDPRRVVVARRVTVAAALVLIVAGIVQGHRGSSPALAWQMFPEASVWQADIVRVTADGSRVDVREPWPGSYDWSDLVRARGVGTPFAERPASYGIAVTLDTLQHALDWVAGHTPNDGETVYLEATVTYQQNADPPAQVVLRSQARPLP